MDVVIVHRVYKWNELERNNIRMNTPIECTSECMTSKHTNECTREVTVTEVKKVLGGRAPGLLYYILHTGANGLFNEVTWVNIIERKTGVPLPGIP
jgi:hypothetical protein